MRSVAILALVDMPRLRRSAIRDERVEGRVEDLPLMLVSQRPILIPFALKLRDARRRVHDRLARASFETRVQHPDIVRVAFRIRILRREVLHAFRLRIALTDDRDSLPVLLEKKTFRALR